MTMIEHANMPDDYPSTILLLIRHGQARGAGGSYNETTPLSDLGHRQAAALARALAAASPPTALYVSPFRRAVETAIPIGAALALAPIVEPGLAEFALGGTSLATLSLRPDLLLWQPDQVGIAGGETLGAFAARVADRCDAIVARHPGQRVAIVAHSGTIDAAVRWALGIGPAHPWQHELDLATASITEVECWPRGRVPGGAPRYTVLRRVGDVSHLNDLVSDF